MANGPNIFQMLLVIITFAVVCAECGEWYVLDEPWVQHSIARFGHSAVVYDNKMYILGGFNGIVLDDMFVYEPGEFPCLCYSVDIYM